MSVHYSDEMLVRDTRSAYTKTIDALEDKAIAATVIALLGGLAIYAPIASVPCLALSALVGSILFNAPSKAPISEPARPGKTAGRGGAKKRRDGRFFLGNDRKTGGEIWLSDDDCRSHFLVFGTTGSGRTETLVGFGANALNRSSGLVYVDGMGDVMVFAKIYAMARRYGREDDVLVLNCLDRDLQSNTMNPFATGDAEALAKIVNTVAFAPGDTWDARSSAVLLAVLRALVEKRDAGGLRLTATEVRNSLYFKSVVDLATDATSVAGETRSAIRDYLASLPSFDAADSTNEAAAGEHALTVLPYTVSLGAFSDACGRVFSGDEIDLDDVVQNRRILVVLLPWRETSEGRASSMGRMILASLRKSLGNRLGKAVEGRYKDAGESRLPTTPSPFFAILDDAGRYCIDGMDVMAAQARSHGISMTYTASDADTLKRMDSDAVGSILANTKTKIVMRVEDPLKAKTVLDMFGRMYGKVARSPRVPVPTVTGFDARHGGKTDDPAHVFPPDEPDEDRIADVGRIKFLDMKSQENGQMHVIYEDKVIRVQGFFANPERSLDRMKLPLRLSGLLKLGTPSPEEIEKWKRLETSDQHPTS
jgi:intracellular multiplication protein IcmO